LDSNIVIRTVLGIGDALIARIGQCDAGDIVISSIVYAEVAYGALKGKPPRIERLDTFLEEVEVLPFDMAAARKYAGLPFKRASYDRLIAAHALSLDLTVITENLADFADVPGLRAENWML
jgi:tRNA(fMet)-specific endonuclease VapC